MHVEFLESNRVDTQELAKIECAVRERTGGMVTALRVRLKDGEVIITGRGSSYYAKQLATHAAFEVRDDVVLRNEIEVG
ncbi:MAG: hypothetical protein KY476_23135 [Planctomycetes bacterium]|nr:hypothetical protein [Planctomycetota bacterium]